MTESAAVPAHRLPLRDTLAVARAPLAAFAAMGILWGSFAASLPDLKSMLQVNEAELGSLLLFTPIAGVLAMLVAPAVGARLGRIALPVVAVLMACAFALPGYVADPLLFPLAMLACGAGTGVTDVLMNARVAQIENRRGLHLMSLSHAAYSFGYTFGALATGAMRGAGWGPDMVLSVMALAALGLAVLTFERDGAIEGLRKPKDRSAQWLGITPILGGGIVLIAFMTENAAEAWSALHIEQTLGGSPSEGALGPAALALTMGIARLASHSVAQRIPPARLMCGGAVVASIGALVAAGAMSPAMAYLGFIVMGLGASILAPTAFSLVGRLARPEARARAVARATLLGYFGYFFGPPMLGLIAGAFGLRMAFVFASCMLVVVLVLAPIMARRRD